MFFVYFFFYYLVKYVIIGSGVKLYFVYWKLIEFVYCEIRIGILLN